MEHNIIDLTTLPQEVHEAIFSIVNAADLCSMSLVSKEILQILTNQRIWKTVCLRDLDLEFFDENSNWMQLASQYCAINHNIRKGRVLVTALVAPIYDKFKGPLYTRRSYVKDEKRILLSWMHTINLGLRQSEWEDIHHHAAILNVTTRQEEESTLLYPEQNAVLIGDRLAAHYRNAGDGNNYFQPTNLMAFKKEAVLEKQLRKVPHIHPLGVVSNNDPAMRHLIVIVDATNTLSVYDLNENLIMKSYTVKDLYKQNYFIHKHDVLFRGNIVYVLDSADVLNVFDLRGESDVPDRIQMDISSPGNECTLLGAHKSIVFGSVMNHQAAATFVWLWDTKASHLKMYHLNDFFYISSMIVHCGVLVVTASQATYFFDYRSDPKGLILRSALQFGECYHPRIEAMKDGKLFVTADMSGVSLIDFEHASDACEILFVEKIGKKQKSTPMTIQAFELISHAKDLLGTHELVSRYFKMNSEQRFGIIYLNNQLNSSEDLGSKKTLVQKATLLISRAKDFLTSAIKGSNQLHLANMEEMTMNKLEYCSPYMYHNMVLGSSTLEPSFTLPYLRSVNEFYGSAIIFYEEWTGTRWKLSKPSSWITEES